MLPIPNIDDAKIPEARKWQEIGSHRRLYTFSPLDYTDVSGVWSGPADWADGEELEVVQGAPDYGAEAPVVKESRSQFSPDYAPEEIYEIAAKLMKYGGISPKQPGEGEHAREQSGPEDSPRHSKQSTKAKRS